MQAYAARYPERLAGLIIDGGFVVEDSDTFFGTPGPQYAVAQVKAICAANAPCAASTDDPAGVLARLLSTLSINPVKQGEKVVADEARVAVLIDQGRASDVIAAAIALEQRRPRAPDGAVRWAGHGRDSPGWRR